MYSSWCGCSDTVSLIRPDVSNPTMNRLLHGVQQHLRFCNMHCQQPSGQPTVHQAGCATVFPYGIFFIVNACINSMQSKAVPTCSPGNLTCNKCLVTCRRHSLATLASHTACTTGQTLHTWAPSLALQ